MRQLKENDYKLLGMLCEMSQKELKATLATFLKKKYKKIVNTKDYIYAVGDIPIALCAHMDTVFTKQPIAAEIFYDRQKGAIWSPKGLGADDRAGVFAIIQIIQKGLRPHIIFTTDEELGCLGAAELAKKKCPFPDLRYIIQLDRRGHDDCVFYDCDNPEFTQYVESFGFVENFGSFSDIYDLCPNWGVAGVNLSIGYINEHSTNEILFVGPLLNTIEKVTKMLKQPIHQIPNFEFIYSVYSVQNYKNYATAYPMEEDDDFEFEDSFQCQCHNCKQVFSSEECLSVTSVEGNHYFLCIDCLADMEEDKLRFCENCGEAFEPIGPKDYICLDCKRGV